MGIKVKIMLPWDPNGKMGPRKPLPDHVAIVEPKDEIPRGEGAAPLAANTAVHMANIAGMKPGEPVGPPVGAVMS